MAGLMDFLSVRNGELRTVVIFKSDLPDFDQVLLESASNSKVKNICIDEIETNSHKLMTFIRSQLRLPLIASSIIADSKVMKSENLGLNLSSQVSVIRKPCAKPGKLLSS